jgi:hypothetical protein
MTRVVRVAYGSSKRRFIILGPPGAIKMWRPPSVTKNLGSDSACSLFFLFLVITKNMNKMLVILGIKSLNKIYALYFCFVEAPCRPPQSFPLISASSFISLHDVTFQKTLFFILYFCVVYLMTLSVNETI